MAENSSAQDKTEKATPKRLKDARKKGQIARSNDLTTLIIAGAAALGILMLGGSIARRFTSWIKCLLTSDAALLNNQQLIHTLTET